MDSRITRRRYLLAGASAVGVSTAGCSGGEEPESTDAPAATMSGGRGGQETAQTTATPSSIETDPDRVAWRRDFGVDDYVMVHDERLYGRLADGGELLAVDLADGETAWSADAVDPSPAPPAVDDRGLYVLTMDDVVVSLDHEGEQRWSGDGPPGNPQYSPIGRPTVVGDYVAVGGSGGAALLDAASGDRLQTYPGEGVAWAPVIRDDTVYYTAGDGRRPDSLRVYAMGIDGSERWQFPVGDSLYCGPALGDGAVFVASTDEYVYAIEAESGAQRWRFETPADNTGSSSQPVYADGTVFVHEGGDRVMFALDAQSGDEVWRFPAPDVLTAVPAIAGDVVVTATPGHLLAIDRESGDLCWAVGLEESIYGPVVTDAHVLYVVEGTVVAVER